MLVETTTELVNLIGSLGFPIIACGALFWMINTTMKELTSAIDKLSDTIQDMGQENS